MNTRFVATAVSAVVLCATVAALGCRSPYAGDRLAGAGALVGAGTGALIARGNPLAGAAIGALVGGASGAIVGDTIDEAEARNQALFQARLGRTMTGSASLHDVVMMSQAGLGDQVIVTHLRNHGLAQPVTAADLVALKQSGVSDVVLAALQQPQAPPTTAGPVYMEGPPIMVAAPPPVIVHDYWGPPPPPPWYWRHPRHCHPGPRVGWGVSVWR